MKKLSELKKEQSELIATDREEKTPRELSAIKKRIQFLKTCIAYLGSQPDENFIKAEVERIEKRLSLINQQYQQWKEFNKETFEDEKKKFAAYTKEMGVPLLKIQSKALKFLLQ